ncbi:MAG: hypothetical protein IPL09_07685 [Bacteroidetes bacterium]|nr:hypothetical protein [Bacteroidota bacterium]
MITDIKFHERLKKYYTKKLLPTGVMSFALDGILDIDKYNFSKLRILWILKEAWGTGLYDNKADYPFEYPNYIKNDFQFGKSFPSSGPMWAKIIYVNYGILNEFKLWNDMPNYWESEEVYYSLKNCALINLKKFQVVQLVIQMRYTNTIKWIEKLF